MANPRCHNNEIWDKIGYNSTYIRNIPVSYTRRVKGDFVLNFVAWQRELVVVEFVWRHSIARPRETPAIRKDLRDISYISRVIADFVPNFVAMATGVIRR